MTDKLSTIAPTDVSSNNIINHQTLPLTAQQCTSHFHDYVTEYQENNNEVVLLLFSEATSVISHYLQLPTPLLFINSRHWLNATQILTKIIPSAQPTQHLLSYHQESLFGRFSINDDEEIVLTDGQLKNNNNGVLVLNISPLLVNPSLWFMLKSVLQRGYLQASDVVNATKIKKILPDLTQHTIDTKIILIATRSQLDELTQIDPEYSQVHSLFCELASHLPVSQQAVDAIINHAHHTTDELNIDRLDNTALTSLLNFLSIQCEHQAQLLFSPELIQQVLQHSNLFTNAHQINSEDLAAYFNEIDQAQSLARKYSEQSLLEGQVNLQLSGQKIGQINGLSVVELLGYPCEFGEIFRISASEMIGDGEIIDVERKVELAGNIHAKSMLIVQAYLNHFFTHINAFPYSCNLVFEQSYQESDGDSASLAILIAASSCYAQYPIKQNMFVTGSLDQHGNVLAIGGINQKIEAVARLFELKLVTEPVFIVMPEANKINLTLNTSTLLLIESGKIVIHAINHCHQAYPLLLDKSFDDVIKAINLRIDTATKEEMGEMPNGLFSRVMHAIFN